MTCVVIGNDILLPLELPEMNIIILIRRLRVASGGSRCGSLAGGACRRAARERDRPRRYCRLVERKRDRLRLGRHEMQPRQLVGIDAQEIVAETHPFEEE